LNSSTDSDAVTSANDSKYTFTVDAFGQLTSVDNHGGETGGTAGVPRVVLNAGFDLNGNRTALNASIGSGSGTADFQDSFTYDHLNQQTVIAQEGASGGNFVAVKEATLAYNANGDKTDLKFYTGYNGTSFGDSSERWAAFTNSSGTPMTPVPGSRRLTSGIIQTKARPINTITPRS
jgi:hypothetical protein